MTIRIVTSRDLSNHGIELILMSFLEPTKHSKAILKEKTMNPWDDGPAYRLDITRKNGVEHTCTTAKHALMGVIPYAEDFDVAKYLVAIPLSSLDENDAFLYKLSNDTTHIRDKVKQLIVSCSKDHWAD